MAVRVLGARRRLGRAASAKPRGSMGKVTSEATSAATRSGLDLSYVDTATRPQDDLFGYVNGRWLAEYEMPADRATDGAFRSLYDRAEEQVRDLIMEASESGAAAGTDE